MRGGRYCRARVSIRRFRMAVIQFVFLTSPRLLRYEKVLKWDNGYLEVIANYNGKEEEPIQRVEVSYGN